MTLDAFRASLTGSSPPTADAALQALWWAARGDWQTAHTIVMKDESTDAAWVHAYLHRVEGDLPNARYWYRQAKRELATAPLEQEWEAIVSDLLG